MPLDQIFRVTDNQRLPSGESIQNVYFYESDNAAGNAEDLQTAFVGAMLPSIRGVQSSALVHYLIEFENIGDVADFTEYSTAGVVGSRAGAIRNEWDAFAYTLRPSVRSVRPGSKRIGGVPEGDAEYTNGVVTDVAMLGFLQSLRTQMGAQLVGTDANYNPVIIKRILDGATYRLPETNLELVSVTVATVLLNSKITHQVSRGNSR